MPHGVLSETHAPAAISSADKRDRRGRMRRVSDDPVQRSVGREPGLSDDDLSPVWVDDDRPRIPRVAGEREALAAYLDYFRATVEMKCRGLTPEQARSSSSAQTTLISTSSRPRTLTSPPTWRRGARSVPSPARSSPPTTSTTHEDAHLLREGVARRG